MHSFCNTKFQQTDWTFQITIDDTVRHMEDKVKNGTLSYLNRVKNTLDQKSRIPLINALIFSHLNYCSSIWGKCSEKLQCEVQKWINFAANVASNGKYLKQGHVTPLLRDLKWINFNSILQLNEASFMYKNLMFQQIQCEKD